MKLATTQVWVNDHDVALEFYVNKLGMEVQSDVTVEEWAFRWLTVAFPGQETAVVLMKVPGEPITDAATRDQINTLVAKGFATALFLTTEDIQADYARLTALGVEFTGEPEEQLYGIDCGMRDPFGNMLRLTQLSDNWS